MENPTYPDSHKIYIKISGSWTDISSDVIGNITGKWGIQGNTPIDRIADTGYLNFTLNNVTGIYSPTSASSLLGWKKGTPVKLEITYQAETYIKFYGTVDEIKIDSGSYGNRKAYVTANDWMDYSAKYPLTNPSILTNKRGNEIVETIVNSMPIPPLASNYEVGENIFPYAFDSATIKTRAYTELNKVALSEIGYIFLTRNKENGETLNFESATARNGLRTLTNIPVPNDNAGFLLNEDSSFLLLETGGKIILNNVQSFSCDNIMEKTDVDYSQNLINQISIRAYPKRIDTGLVVLFSLDKPLLVPSSNQISFNATYSDPANGNQINGTNLQAPVATTDYLFNTLSSGSGTNITADLIVNAAYSAQGIKYTLTNSNIQAGYVTFLQARGFGIYAYNPIEAIVESQESIDTYGYSTKTLDQKLQTSLTTGFVAGQTFINEDKDPRTILQKVYLLANNSENLMQAFLSLDVGSLVHIAETRTGIDGYYYIQAVDFSITPGGVIKYSWDMIEHLSLLSGGLSKVSIGCAASTTQGINYGYLPRLANLNKRTYTGWINMNALVSGFPKSFMEIFSDYSGTSFYPRDNGKLEVYAKCDGLGKWTTTGSNLWAPGVWTMISMTRDITTDPLTDPIIYVNGSPVAITESNTPTGNYRDETGCLWLLGNEKTTTINYTYPLSGSLKDCRVYNRILSETELTNLYNGIEVTDGLIFQGPTIKTIDSVLYNGKNLIEDQKLIDNIYSSIGTPSGSPICNVL